MVTSQMPNKKTTPTAVFLTYSTLHNSLLHTARLPVTNERLRLVVRSMTVVIQFAVFVGVDRVRGVFARFHVLQRA